MELVVEGFGKEYVIEVGEDDTTETMRQKVASATGLYEDSFSMGLGGKDEGEDINITALSAGDIIFLTKKPKYEAIAALRALGETNLTAERLKQVQDPKVASLLLQAEVATAIPNDFFGSGAVMRIAFSSVSDVDDNCASTLCLPALPCITEVGEKFFSWNTTLSTVDLTGLEAVTTIGHGFLSWCTAMSTIDLTGLQSVNSIGDSFLSGCWNMSYRPPISHFDWEQLPRRVLDDVESRSHRPPISHCDWGLLPPRVQHSDDG